MSSYAWGAYGQQGEERQRQEQELAKRQQEQRERAAQWQARIPAWEDGVRQTDALLAEARARQAAAQAETARCWDELEKACFYRQRGEAARSAEGHVIMDNRHPEVAGQNAAMEDAREAERKARARVLRLEQQKDYFRGLIAQARGMG